MSTAVNLKHIVTKCDALTNTELSDQCDFIQTPSKTNVR